MDLTQLRKEIDKIDKELIEILAKRYDFRAKIWEEKRRTGQPLRTPEREHQIIERQKEQARKKGIPEAAIEMLYKALFSEN